VIAARHHWTLRTRAAGAKAKHAGFVRRSGSGNVNVNGKYGSPQQQTHPAVHTFASRNLDPGQVPGVVQEIRSMLSAAHGQTREEREREAKEKSVSGVTISPTARSGRLAPSKGPPKTFMGFS